MEIKGREHMEKEVRTQQLRNCFHNRISRTRHLDPHPGLIVASHDLSEPYPLVNEISFLSLSTYDLLIKYVYPCISGYGKFTIIYTLRRTSDGNEIPFALGPAIPLTSNDGNLLPKSEVYAHIKRYITKYMEIYDGDIILNLMIRVYLEGKKTEIPALSEEDRYLSLSEIMEAELTEVEPITARKIINRKRSYPTHIRKVKACCKKRKSFLVADIETMLIDNVHKPYAAGLLRVCPGERLNPFLIETYFSEDYSRILNDFEERSQKVLYDLVLRIDTIVRRAKSPMKIYFHNFSRFDGIILLKHLACHHMNYKLKPLMRNHRLYELAVYEDKKMLFCFRDSFNLLPGKLITLAKNLCPDLGTKGSIPYDEVRLETLLSMKRELLDYMKQDILLLGGIMRKAQEIYWELFQLDIESQITLSSLAISIFLQRYYNESHFPIHIPNKNEDHFIRRAYYGGHTDVYKPYGKDLYYYDVNSLYPFIMKEFAMPGGVPVWNGNLEGKDLDSLFGFLEAYVICPKTLKKPFLPYRDKNHTLIFPTGEFIGVYYSEELKYAKGLGYTVVPISGYLFEKKESPFKEFVSSLYENRFKAKKEGNDAMSYVYKILMNSLYGRLGIHPKSTITEICDKERSDDLIRKSELIFCEMLKENIYIVSYHSNTEKGPDYWNPPKNSAVQIAAAITASARIYMYPYISREDSYYTDTDSVVLGQPLPKELINSIELGKFKLEDKIIEGYFLSPKSYSYLALDGKNVLKFKGPAKEKVTPEWFLSQYADPSQSQNIPIEANFRIDWHTLNIIKKDTAVTIGIKQGIKRKPIWDKNQEKWVDTDPIEIIDLSSLDYIGKQVIKSLRNEIIQLQNEKSILFQKLSKIENKSSYVKKETEEHREEESTTVQPTIYKTKEKKEDHKPDDKSASPDRPKPET